MLHINQLSVTARNGDCSLLHPVTLTLRRGKITGVMGESGCGKSILAHAVLGYAPEGFLIKGNIGGKPVVALAAQSAGILDPVKTVWQHLFRWQKMEKATDTSSFALLGIDRDIAASYRHQLSGGMGKRALLAQALVQNPEYILADEPCAGLDDASANRMYHQLRQQADNENTGVMLITHNLRQLMRWADDILVMKGGQVVEFTTPGKITTGVCQPYTTSLWEALPENWEAKRADAA
ncbi:ATP-binding cassette domain-containing protein [Parasalinivibrio latis]|uniref:ATP-binding cassette domain-containing protein n=1 Tax=Parasalinivibrio latis TaxID=2952610 RepID=UPI0030E0A7E6